MKALTAVLGLCAVSCAEAKYNMLTMAMKSYAAGDPVGPIKVNTLFSQKELVSLDFYSLKFCRPEEDVLNDYVNTQKLGEVMWGDRIAPSVYEANMMEDVKCRTVRSHSTCANGDNIFTPADMDRFNRRIRHEYRGAFVLDNLPAISNGTTISCAEGAGTLYDPPARGFALGVPETCTGTGKAHINNHLAFHIHVRKDERDADEGASSTEPETPYSIVGFYIVPMSVNHLAEGGTSEKCADDFDEMAPHSAVTAAVDGPEDKKTKEVVWSYSVKFTVTNLPWSRRWESYLNLAFSNRNEKIHWLGIVNSSLIILCLALIVAMIMVRTLRMDILNATMDKEEQQGMRDDAGWKMVYGDVFRPPSSPRMYAILFGTGMQLLAMVVSVFAFALQGLLSPANRGGLLTTAILLFVVMAFLNGYCTSVALKMFNIVEWRPVFMAGIMFPGICMCMWVFAQIVINWNRPGYNGTPVLFNTVKIFALWIGVAVPLVVLGASAARAKTFNLEPPSRVHAVARQIPAKPFYLEGWFLILVPGIVPFGAAFIELRLILSSMWQGMSYYMFGYLALTFLTLLVVAVEVTVVAIYLVLVAEDHQWWWKAFALPAGMALHFFTYSLYYAVTQLGIATILSKFIFSSTMFVVSMGLYIALGAIGQLSGYLFVRIIYGSIKCD